MRLRTVVATLGDLAPRGSLVLDLGGYDGSISTAVDGVADRLVVVDLDDEGLRKARTSGAAAVLGSATAIPMASGSVDVALSFDLLPCIDGVDSPRVYPELRRVLRAGGHLLITEVDETFKLPLVDNEVAFARWRVRTGGFSYSQLQQLLGVAGFDVVAHTRFYGLATRLAYTVLFFWGWPRRGSRLKLALLRTLAGLECRWCPAPRAHFIVAKARG